MCDSRDRGDRKEVDNKEEIEKITSHPQNFKIKTDEGLWVTSPFGSRWQALTPDLFIKEHNSNFSLLKTSQNQASRITVESPDKPFFIVSRSTDAPTIFISMAKREVKTITQWKLDEKEGAIPFKQLPISFADYCHNNEYFEPEVMTEIPGKKGLYLLTGVIWEKPVLQFSPILFLIDTHAPENKMIRRHVKFGTQFYGHKKLKVVILNEDILGIYDMGGLHLLDITTLKPHAEQPTLNISHQGYICCSKNFWITSSNNKLVIYEVAFQNKKFILRTRDDILYGHSKLFGNDTFNFQASIFHENNFLLYCPNDPHVYAVLPEIGKVIELGCLPDAQCVPIPDCLEFVMIDKITSRAKIHRYEIFNPQLLSTLDNALREIKNPIPLSILDIISGYTQPQPKAYHTMRGVLLPPPVDDGQMSLLFLQRLQQLFEHIEERILIAQPNILESKQDDFMRTGLNKFITSMGKNIPELEELILGRKFNTFVNYPILSEENMNKLLRIRDALKIILERIQEKNLRTKNEIFGVIRGFAFVDKDILVKIINAIQDFTKQYEDKFIKGLEKSGNKKK